MSAFIDPILRGTLFVWLVIALGLTGNLIATQNFTVSQVNFGLFAAVFGLVFGVFYGLGAAFVEALAFPIVLATLDFLNMVFLFSGATALAVAVRHCSNNPFNSVFQGSNGRCTRGRASVAFLYLGFFTILAAFAYSITNVIRNGAFSLPSMRKRSPPRTGVPTMSQV